MSLFARRFSRFTLAMLMVTVALAGCGKGCRKEGGEDCETGLWHVAGL